MRVHNRRAPVAWAHAIVPLSCAVQFWGVFDTQLSDLRCVPVQRTKTAKKKACPRRRARGTTRSVWARRPPALR